MKFLRGQTQSPPNFLSFALVLLSLFAVVSSSDICAPVTWSKANVRRAVPTSSSISNGTAPTSSASSNVTSRISTGNVTVGEVNCRYSSTTYSDVNYYTCTQLADRYGITVESFFILNPELDLDCSNIQPNTEYCVAGFIEPLRATAGLCGPPNQNATCLGTAYQCCNANTWTCGNSTADCAPGTCYEGACVGDDIFGTDGTCGYQNGNRLCAGVWGDCCNMNGTCGTGDAFCGTGQCQSGNCTRPAVIPTVPSWLTGNTTDGTCGGENFTTCNVVYGNCCNKDGICGSLMSDCGVGCQPQFGSCSSLSSTTTSSITKSSLSTTVTSSSKSSSTKTTTTTTHPSSSSSKIPSSAITAISSLPSCGQTCFSNMLAQYSTLGCSSPDPGCLCKNVNFGYGIRDCSNGACGSAVASTVIAFESGYCSSALATAATKLSSSTTTTAKVTGISGLPACGQTCFSNMLAQYSTLGCSSPDPSCLCSNVNFGYGIRDCSNGACGAAIASTVIAFESAYCSSALATRTATPTTTTTAKGVDALPSCGQVCWSNMQGQWSALGCPTTSNAACLCKNVNFGYGIRDCANGACGTAVGSTVIAFGSSYCASATATA